MSQTPNMIYSRLLLPKGNGYPMYVPEPPDAGSDHEQKKKYHDRGVDIGDVGVLRADGSFDFIFSICHTEVNFLGVPQGYESIQIRTEEIHSRDGYHCTPRHIVTDSMSGTYFNASGELQATP